MEQYNFFPSVDESQFLYLITRNDWADWDETRGIVVRASSYDEALSLAVHRTEGPYGYLIHPGFAEDGSNLDIRIIGVSFHGPSEVVIEDFNAG